MEVNGGCCKYLDFVFSKNHFNKIIVNYKILHSPPLGDILLHPERLSRATFVAAKRVNPLTTFLCETTSHCYNRSFCFAGAIYSTSVILVYFFCHSRAWRLCRNTFLLSFLPPTRTLEGKLRRGTRTCCFYWIPACAGMTKKRYYDTVSKSGMTNKKTRMTTLLQSLFTYVFSIMNALP